jgi:hypothetical protein
MKCTKKRLGADNSQAHQSDRSPCESKKQSDVEILHQKDQPFQNKVANLAVNLAFVKGSREWLDCLSLIQYRERRKLQQPPEAPDRPSQLPTLQIVADREIQRGDMLRELAVDSSDKTQATRRHSSVDID